MQCCAELAGLRNGETNMNGSWADLLADSGTAITDPYQIGALNPIRYRGYYYDTDTQLYYLQSRYYDPEVSRSLNADELIDIDRLLGINQFTYCNNCPIMLEDSTGCSGRTISLGMNWYYRIDQANEGTATQRHIHIWNDQHKYSQNEDGSPHDKGGNSDGKIPKWVNKAIDRAEGWN